MPIEKTKSTDTTAAGLVARTGASERGGAGGVFTVTCYDKDGNLKWEEKTHNTVMQTGLQSMNNVYFDATTQITSWYVGLITGPAASTTITDTQTLASHGTTGGGGWTENTSYSGNRKLANFGTGGTLANPSVISNSGSAASFTMTGSATIAGAFLCNVEDKTNNVGTLFSAADFQSPGDRSVVTDDILNVTYTFSLTGT